MSSDAAAIRTCWRERGDQVHLDARLRGVPDRAMRELADVEVGAELAVDPHQQVAVERRRHAERIVVGQQQVALRLHEVGADQQRVAGRQRRADVRRKASAPGGSKLPMFEPRNSVSVPAGAAPLARRPRRGPLRMSPGASRRRRVTPSSAASVAAGAGRAPPARRRRDARSAGGRDRGRPRSASPASRRCPGRARRASRPARRARRSRGRAAASRSRLRARDAVPRQLADRLEQRRAERVVEVPRRQLPRRQRQVVLDVARELLERPNGRRR